MTAQRIPYAYYPRMLFLLMQVLMLGTAPSYSYSGKVEAVDWLLKKARGKARERVCTLRHQGVAGRQINYGDFFDIAVRPNTINAVDWEDMSNVAYDCILACIHDEKLQYLLAGIDAGDGTELMKRLQNVCGNKQQRIDQLDGKIASVSVATLSGWTNCRDQMKTLLQKRNSIPQLQNNEIESDAKQLRQFVTPLATLFPTLFENYVLDSMKDTANGGPVCTIQSVIDVSDALYQARSKTNKSNRMSVMPGDQSDGASGAQLAVGFDGSNGHPGYVY